MWRSVARSQTPGISLEKKSYAGEDSSGALIGKQRAFFEDEGCFVETPCYDGELPSNGMKVDGPAIIVLLDTTIVVPKQFMLSIQEQDYYIMEAL
jgi:N-methylhydantoinase A